MLDPTTHIGQGGNVINDILHNNFYTFNSAFIYTFLILKINTFKYILL